MIKFLKSWFHWMGTSDWIKKKLSYKDQDKISYIQINQMNEQKFLTLAFQTNAIIEKNIGIDWWSGNKNMANRPKKRL